MRILGGVIAVAVVVAFAGATWLRWRSKWRADEDLFDGSPQVVVRRPGGPTRTDLLVRLADSHGYVLAVERDAEASPERELVFVRRD